MFDLLTSFISSKESVDNATLVKICSCFECFKTIRNEMLLDYEQVASHYYFVNKGAVRLFTMTEDGQELSRYFAFESTFVTALPSFIDQKPAHEYLQTIEKSTLLRISRADFFHLVATIPVFAKIYTEILELGFIMAQKRIYGFQGHDALYKVQWMIENQPKLLSRVSNKMVASYLGIAPATLSRLKAKL
jgi:CRP-like cAMP-binding protein